MYILHNSVCNFQEYRFSTAHVCSIYFQIYYFLYFMRIFIRNRIFTEESDESKNDQVLFGILDYIEHRINRTQIEEFHSS